ncbi:hypothetical protein ACHAPI_011812, partial [Fusarium lateritium]
MPTVLPDLYSTLDSAATEKTACTAQVHRFGLTHSNIQALEGQKKLRDRWCGVTHVIREVIKEKLREDENDLMLMRKFWWWAKV